MGFGVALSIRSLLGATPISSIPTVANTIWSGLSIGTYTIVLNCFMVLAQYFILKGQFGWYQLMQIPLVLLFGFFIDFHLYLTAALVPTSYIAQLATALLSCVVLAIGVYFQVRSGVSYLPVEGLVVAIKRVYGGHFGRLKVIVDGSMALTAIIIGLLFLGEVVAVREGTVLSALLVGTITGAIERFVQRRADK